MEPRIQRRLAAIVAADVAGYSRLTGRDEERTVAALAAHRRELIDPKIAEYRGRIANTAGDSILAEFPSVVEALRCALDVQRGMAERNAEVAADDRIAFRMGINLGDVIEQDGDLLGDGVNVAARLESLAPPGGICLSRAARDQVRDKMDIALEDMGAVEVKNIARPVRAFRVAQVGDGAKPPPARSARRRRPWSVLAAALLLIAVVVGAAVWWRPWGSQPAAPSDDKLSIVVLPFENLAADPKQDYFADAITEDLISDLSRIRGAFVIARSTSFSFKNKGLSARQVAEELGVRYVLEGSVQRVDHRVRVNAELIDGETGANLWSEKFDRQLEDVIALQSDITGHIAAVLRAELLEAESRRPKPANPQAWELAVQGQVMLHRPNLGPSVFPEAKALFEQALALDPNLALAWEGLAWIDFVAATRELAGISGPNSSDLALEEAQRAVAIDPRSSNAYRVLGLAHYWKGEGDRALTACQKALELNPNNDEAYICASRANYISGNLKEAIRLIEKAVQLNPRFRPWLRNFYIGTSQFFLKDYQNAVASLDKAAADFPTQQSIMFYRAAALAMAGQEEQAHVVLADYLKLADGKRDTIEKLRADRAHIEPDFELLAEGLRRAGMPER